MMMWMSGNTKKQQQQQRDEQKKFPIKLVYTTHSKYNMQYKPFQSTQKSNQLKSNGIGC